MPEDLTAAFIAVLINLPLASAILFAFYKGWFRLGADVKREMALKEEEIKYRDDRLVAVKQEFGQRATEWKNLYDREREDRLAAVQQIAALSEVVKDSASISERSLAMTEKLLYEYVGRRADRSQ